MNYEQAKFQKDESLYNIITKLTNVKDKGLGIYIFGSGLGGKIVLEYLKENFADLNIKGIFDNNLEKYGKHLLDIEISAPLKNAIESNDYIIITSLTYNNQILNQLLDMGVVENKIICSGKWLSELLQTQSSYKLAYIDLVDTCNLVCSTCPRSIIRGTGQKMSLEMFCKIIDKLKEAKYSLINLFNWSEPFLHPELLNFVKEIKARSFACGLSTNFALPEIPHLIDVLDALNPDDGDFLIVSLSGMNQSVYEINHKGGKVEAVKQNIKIASKSKNKNLIRARLIKFSYNKKEEEELIEFCNAVGVKYEVIEGGGNPLDRNFMPERIAAFDTQTISQSHNCRDLASLAACPFIFDITVIDAKGDAYLCCTTPPMQQYNLGSFLDQDLSVLTLKRYVHPFCATCCPPSSRRAFSKEDLQVIKQGLQNL